ncbi:MAG TPA: PilN domain-containing protein [Gemmatimonadaceae bacterium]|nr:PilN domain-containing protein [Gemmatimonadaceae bacterium]
MIEINLAPSTGKKKARGGRSSGGGGSGVSLGAVIAGVVAKVKDPYLIGAVATASLAIVAVGGLWTTQSAQARDLTDREQRAVQDSTRYAAVLADRHKAEAQRDSVVRQLNIIKSIDNNRFVWAHVMDEVGKSLPAYTWLTSIVQTSAPPTAQAAETAKKDDKGGAEKPAEGGAKTGKDAKGKAPAEAAPAVMKFHMVGNTVDIQALTRFMKDLEASPFVQNVQLVKTSLVMQDGKEVTEFQLDAEYQTPEPGVIRTVPVSLSVR